MLREEGGREVGEGARGGKEDGREEGGREEGEVG